MSWSSVAAALLLLPGSFAIVWLVTALGVLIALRRMRKTDGLPWTERARRAYPARRAAAFGGTSAAIMLAVSILSGGIPPLGFARSGMTWAVLGGLAGLYGGLDVASRLEWRFCRQVVDQPRAGFALRGVFLAFQLLPLSVMLLLIPMRWGWRAMVVLGLGAALVTLAQLGVWLPLLRRLGQIRPATERLQNLVDRASERVGVRPRATLELASPNANALALPTIQTLIFTGPIVAALDDDELMTITVHELGHLAEPRAVYLTRRAAAYLVVVCVAGIPLAGSYGIWAGLAAPAFYFAGMYLYKAVARRMEERSDRLGREHEGDSAGTYARALEKLYEANLMPAVLREKQIHPNLYDRLVAAGVTPAYDRPAPPKSDWLALIPAIALIVGTTLVIFDDHASIRLAQAFAEPTASSRAPSGSPSPDRSESPRPSAPDG